MRITTPDGPMRAIVGGSPDSAGAIVVLHQAGGLSPQIDSVVAWLAESGYYAVAPDLFHRKDLAPGFNPMAEFRGDMQKFSLWLEGDRELLSDIEATLAYLDGLGSVRDAVGVLGYSYGGRAAFLAAATQSIGAAVSWYAPGIQRKNFEQNLGLPALADRIADLRAPWLGIFGEQDGLIPPDELDELQAALSAHAPVATDVVRYDQAGHAFDATHGGPPPRPGAPPPNPVAAAAGRARTLDWFHSQLSA